MKKILRSAPWASQCFLGVFRVSTPLPAQNTPGITTKKSSSVLLRTGRGRRISWNGNGGGAKPTSP